MKHTISATNARIHFGELMQRVVEHQEPVIVERSGTPYVVMIPVEKYERLQAEAETRENWRTLVPQARAQVRSDLGGRALTPPEDVLRALREAHDDQRTPTLVAYDCRSVSLSSDPENKETL
jgi:prevent-host-death family protein